MFLCKRRGARSPRPAFQTFPGGGIHKYIQNGRKNGIKKAVDNGKKLYYDDATNQTAGETAGEQKMNFSKNYQPRHRGGGRRPKLETIAAQRSAETKEREQSRAAFEAFERASVGAFNGFEFVAEFHAAYNKRDALEVLTANDCAEVTTSAGAKLHTGADGVTAYIMTAEARRGNVKKKVGFNRSIYFF